MVHPRIRGRLRSLLQSTASCKARGHSGLSRQFGRVWRYTGGELGYSQNQIRTDGSELGQYPRVYDEAAN
jgi:hypothetical protein